MLRGLYGFDVIGCATINYDGKVKRSTKGAFFRKLVRRPSYKKVYVRLREPGLAVLPPNDNARAKLDEETAKRWDAEAAAFAKAVEGSYAGNALLQVHSNQRGNVSFPPRKEREDMNEEELAQDDALTKMEIYVEKEKARARKLERLSPMKYQRRARARRILKRKSLKTV